MDTNGLSMKTRLIGAAVIAVLVLVIGIWGRSAYLRHQAAVNSDRSNASSIQGSNHAAKGEVHDAQAQRDAAAKQENDAKAPAYDDKVSSLEARNAELQRKLDAARQGQRPANSPGGQGVQSSTDDPSLVERLKLQDELIASQADTIKAQDERYAFTLQRLADRDQELKSVYAARDEYKLSASFYQQAYVQEHAARVAAEGVAKAERLKGRIEGALFGVGADRGLQALGIGRFK
ncbi:hypothetical protein [Mesoterricola silvestris]|uniref:Uncharacterized protein n=1 Tax=Mesoterricola silvestris TaxID=2927979 RepID=A0AA48K8J7_9BACT|nr:hypothetical protein [Mesoterricola silvestris]BDU72381.1 hypothetical protein METEAL_15550 [Mesoterricola silvestris]